MSFDKNKSGHINNHHNQQQQQQQHIISDNLNIETPQTPTATSAPSEIIPIPIQDILNEQQSQETQQDNNHYDNTTYNDIETPTSYTTPIIDFDLPSSATILHSPFTNSTIILVGSVHIHKGSSDEVSQVIRNWKPDTVFIELCSSRAGIILNNGNGSGDNRNNDGNGNGNNKNHLRINSNKKHHLNRTKKILDNRSKLVYSRRVPMIERGHFLSDIDDDQFSSSSKFVLETEIQDIDIEDMTQEDNELYTSEETEEDDEDDDDDDYYGFDYLDLNDNNINHIMNQPRSHNFYLYDDDYKDSLIESRLNKLNNNNNNNPNNNNINNINNITKSILNPLPTPTSSPSLYKNNLIFNNNNINTNININTNNGDNGSGSSSDNISKDELYISDADDERSHDSHESNTTFTTNNDTNNNQNNNQTDENISEFDENEYEQQQQHHQQQESISMKDVINIIKNNGLSGVLHILMAELIRKAGKQSNVGPGSEFITAFIEAKKIGSLVVLGDRLVEITLQRVWNSLGAWEKVKFVFYLFMASLSDVSKEEIDAIKNSSDELVTQLLNEFRGRFPSVVHTIVTERDQYMAARLRMCPGNKIVAVVGKGHISGIVREWNNLNINLFELESVNIIKNNDKSNNNNNHNNNNHNNRNNNHSKSTSSSWSNVTKWASFILIPMFGISLYFLNKKFNFI